MVGYYKKVFLMQREIRIIYDDQHDKEVKEAVGYITLFLSVTKDLEGKMIDHHKNIVILDLTSVGVEP